MIITLPMVPANFKNLRPSDEILFRFFKEWNGALIHCAIHHQTVNNLHEGYLISKENTDFPFANEMGNEIDRYQSHIYRYSRDYYAFLFATLQTNEDEIAREFSDRLEVREETESHNKAFLESYGITDLDSLVAKVNAIRPQ